MLPKVFAAERCRARPSGDHGVCALEQHLLDLADGVDPRDHISFSDWGWTSYSEVHLKSAKHGKCWGHLQVPPDCPGLVKHLAQISDSLAPCCSPAESAGAGWSA